MERSEKRLKKAGGLKLYYGGSSVPGQRVSTVLNEVHVEGTSCVRDY